MAASNASPLRAHVDRLRPAVVDHLRPRPAVDRDDDGGAARRLRAIDRCMQLDPIAGAKRVELGRREINGDIGRRRDRDHGLAIAHPDDVDVWRFRPAVPNVDVAGEIGRDHGAVHSGCASQALRITAVQRNPEELPLEGCLHPADKVELAALLVQSHRGFGRPLAAGQLPDQRAIGRI